MIVVKTFGITRNNNGRYAVTTDISADKTRYNASYDLTYVKADFALRKAEDFIRSCYQDFTNFQGEPIQFKFKNMGLIN